MRKIFKITFGFLLIVNPYIFQSLSNEKEANKPNIIIIFTDDQGYNDLGCYGSPLIKTPNIDKLASEGIRFTNFYAQPICGPSRTALLTGCYPLRVAEVGNIKRVHPFVHPNELLLPEVLREGGYKTGCIGKWDLNGHKQSFPNDRFFPTEMGFDFWFGLPSSNDNGAKNLYRNKKLLGSVPVDTLTQLYTSEALKFIDRNNESPFFLYLAHSMPHTKLGAGKQFNGKSAGGLYGDVIEELDWSVGVIKEKLFELGLDKNTIIIYTSDNGPWHSRGTHGGSAFPLRSGKNTTWEGGVRVPCIIWGTGLLKKGHKAHQVVSTMDLLPTLANIGKAKLPKDLTIDGKDISTLILANVKSEILEEVYYYYHGTHLQAVRSGNWKLVLPRPQAPEWIKNSKRSIWRYKDMEPVRDYELYNLKNDISERRDIAAQYPEKIKELIELAEKAREEIGDYNKIGKGARFYDEGSKRPEAIKWQEKEKNGWKQEIEIHPYYNSGARNL